MHWGLQEVPSPEALQSKPGQRLGGHKGIQAPEALLQARATCDPRGSTCCHPLDKPEEQTEHAFINVLTRGDLSSIRWVCSPLRHSRPTAPGVQLCTIYYASLNFRDIMLATGKLSPDAIPGTGSPR